MKSLTPKCIWLTGLSGSGKSTIAHELRDVLQKEGLRIKILDGDALRASLNADLGFSISDRAENIRRSACVAKLFLDEGFWVISAFITPTENLRELAKNIIGQKDYLEIFISASYATCQKRDPKGLYKKVEGGLIRNFTGKDSSFEMPANPDFVADTENKTLKETMKEINSFILDLPDK